MYRSVCTPYGKPPFLAGLGPWRPLRTLQLGPRGRFLCAVAIIKPWTDGPMNQRTLATHGKTV